MFDECASLALEQRTARVKLDKFPQTTHTRLSDIVLGNHDTENQLQRMKISDYRQIDLIRKRTVRAVMLHLPEPQDRG